MHFVKTLCNAIAGLHADTIPGFAISHMVSDGHLASETTVHRWQGYHVPRAELEHFGKVGLHGGTVHLAKWAAAPR